MKRIRECPKRGFSGDIAIFTLLYILAATSIYLGPGCAPDLEGESPQEIGKPGAYPIVDTNQKTFFDTEDSIAQPSTDSPFYAQDARFPGNAPSYTKMDDGTVKDNVTGLIWQKSYGVYTREEALAALEALNKRSLYQWRIPSIKEAYSLMDFSGEDPSGPGSFLSDGRPFINTEYLDFKYGANGMRPIDSQMLSSTVYRGRTMMYNPTVFGVNFADGRIKGYPIVSPRGPMKFMVRFVRGNPDYGKNLYRNNGDGTLSDLATGLMWSREDSKQAMNWEDALKWVQELNRKKHLGYSDWRLPDAKELQSIVDYGRSPQEDSGPAIDPAFLVSRIKVEEGRMDWPFYWSSTTHKNPRNGRFAVYVCFGEALGYFAPPRSGRKPELMDVHGAGAQRSDPKSGDPSRFPRGHGPQGDVIRILHYVRPVRNF